MQKLNSPQGQFIGSIISIIIWFILICTLLYALLTNQFSEIAGKVICSILIIISLLFLISAIRSYAKNRMRIKNKTGSI
jgi:membrane protein DedA with SNARE-associated domain